MKKILSAFLSLLLIITAVPIAHALNKNGFVYTDNGDGTCTITSYRNFREADVDIPNNFDGLTVTGIASNAFKQKSAIEEVRIPNTVTYIGAYAFYGCTKLRSVIIGTGVTTIGDHAFNGCVSLTGVNVKNAQHIGEYAFNNCTALTEFSSSPALKTIGKRAFWKCALLDYLKFSEGIEEIGDYAFAECSAIPSLKFPDSLKKIGLSAFSNCTALETVTFGNGALEIGAYAFENCILLTEVTIPKTVVSIGKNAFAFREPESTQFTHSVKIICNIDSAGVKYSINSSAPVYIIELGRTVDNFGDIDGKDGITTEDARKALRLAASLEKEPDEETLFLGDLNRNGYIDIEDARTILTKVAGITPQQ